MARPSQELIQAIRATARNLQANTSYQWGHMGACNCGNLAQQLTPFSKAEIHAYAMQGRGDWSEQVNAFCPTSETPMDLLISQLVASGLSLEDLVHLERLSDREVLVTIPAERRQRLRHNQKEDVILYLTKWADLLEDRLQRKISNTVKSSAKELVH